MSEKIKEEQIIFLQKIKPILSSSFLPISKVDDRATVISTQDGTSNLDELVKRIEKIEEMLEIQGGGVRTGKVKEQIISLLQQNKRLTSSQLSKLVGLSRTRCSEYFRELTREGKTEGIIINRQKYYKLVGK
jgi:Fic family protein